MGHYFLCKKAHRRLGILQTDGIEDAALNSGDKVEHPNGSCNIQIDKVEESQPRRTEPEIEAYRIAKQR